jgi:N utilization substance protein B
MIAGSRRKARAYALQVLYARDVEGGTDVGAALAGWSTSFELEIDDAARAFASELVQGTVGNLAKLDEIIAGASKNWRLERMSRVDRNLLRLGTYELMFREDVPRAVILDEAVELAKSFGTEESPSFVNGVLDRIANDVGRKDER